MSYRFMRILVFFDLPVGTSSERREYVKFRRFLIKKGFLMMQQSVYCKLALNQTVKQGIVKSVKENSPDEGLVQILVVTEKQFAKMEYIVGEKRSTIIDSDERIIIL